MDDNQEYEYKLTLLILGRRLLCDEQNETMGVLLAESPPQKSWILVGSRKNTKLLSIVLLQQD